MIHRKYGSGHFIASSLQRLLSSVYHAVSFEYTMQTTSGNLHVFLRFRALCSMMWLIRDVITLGVMYSGQALRLSAVIWLIEWRWNILSIATVCPLYVAITDMMWTPEGSKRLKFPPHSVIRY